MLEDLLRVKVAGMSPSCYR